MPDITKVPELWELFWPQSPPEDHRGRSSNREVIEFEVSANDFSNSEMFPPLLLGSQCHAWPAQCVAQAGPKSSNNGFGEAKYLLLF